MVGFLPNPSPQARNCVPVQVQAVKGTDVGAVAGGVQVTESLLMRMPSGEELRACPGAGREGHRRGRGRWRRPSDGITADANAIIPDGNVARAGVAETVEA